MMGEFNHRQTDVPAASRQRREMHAYFRVLVLVVAILMPSSSGRLLADPQNVVLQPADPYQVLLFLHQSVDWYRHFSVEQQLVTEPADAPFLNDDRQLADHIISLSFEFALANADLQAQHALAVNPGPDQSGSSTQSKYRSLLDMAAKADQLVKQAEDELAHNRQKLAGAYGRERTTLESTIAELQGEIDLAQTRRDVLRNMAEFVGGLDSGKATAGSLRAQIQELQRSVPAALSQPAAPGQTPPPAVTGSSPSTSVPTQKAQPSGLLGLLRDLFSLKRKMHALDQAIELTDALAKPSRAFRTPVGSALRDMSKRGDDLAVQADASSPAGLQQESKDLDALTLQFKQGAAVVLPLSKQGILLDLYKRSLSNWRAATRNEYNAGLKTLLMELLALGLVILILVVLSEIWRRATFRYVTDFRRRNQFLLVRRIVVWFAVIIIIAFAFASELGALATFAGLLTAGVAFALQNVILAVAGYFFLIGKYGVRVGDRVQIGSVTGEVVDIGLVRMHLIEFSSGETEAQPTGRVVGFSNSIVFQPGSGFFKQIPETNFIWHQITLTLAPESDYREVEERLMGAVTSVLAEYRDDLELQRRHMERSLSTLAVKSFEPQSRLRLTQSGLEVVIRYPLELENAAEIDDRITRSLLDAIDHPPKLKLVGTGTPNLQPASATG
jgi:small-conductance mechanosensitive channel